MAHRGGLHRLTIKPAVACWIHGDGGLGDRKQRHWRTTVFDLSVGKPLVLAVLVAVIFGPGAIRLLAGQASRTLRGPRHRP